MPRLLPLALIVAIPLGVMAVRNRARTQRPIDRLRREARLRIARARTTMQTSVRDAVDTIAQAVAR